MGATFRKRRRRAAWLVLRIANGFWRLAGNPVRAILPGDEWRAWETENFRKLHEPEFSAGCDARGVWMATLPGLPLDRALVTHTLTPVMLAAAARELRRAHALTCDFHRAGWSHADPHTGNFLYDPATDRARLIDFEVRHLRGLPAIERHADDLLVLLQDVCGRCRAQDWPALARAVGESYAEPAVLAHLCTRFRVPRGFARLWWGVRTTWLSRSELERRAGELRAILGVVES